MNETERCRCRQGGIALAGGESVVKPASRPYDVVPHKIELMPNLVSDCLTREDVRQIVVEVLDARRKQTAEPA